MIPTYKKPMPVKPESHHHTCSESTDHHCPGCCSCECCGGKSPRLYKTRGGDNCYCDENLGGCGNWSSNCINGLCFNCREEVEGHRKYHRHYRTHRPPYYHPDEPFPGPPDQPMDIDEDNEEPIPPPPVLRRAVHAQCENCGAVRERYGVGYQCWQCGHVQQNRA